MAVWATAGARPGAFAHGNGSKIICKHNSALVQPTCSALTSAASTPAIGSAAVLAGSGAGGQKGVRRR